MRLLTTALSSQSSTIYRSVASARRGWASITASGDSEHTRTHAAFCITARGSTSVSATRPTSASKCCAKSPYLRNRFGSCGTSFEDLIMKEQMKILIGYDGSPCADAALDDLRRAGLSREAQAIILSVFE